MTTRERYRRWRRLARRTWQESGMYAFIEMAITRDAIAHELGLSDEHRVEVERASQRRAFRLAA